MKVILPHQFTPRPYQVASNRAYFIHGKRFSIEVLHRRAGKSKNALNFILAAAMQRVGSYYHTFPELTQARRAIWNGIDKDGKRYLDHIPNQLIAGLPNNSDMRINLINGSSIQLAGADRYDALMGSNPAGIIFDEYSIQNPFAWHYLSPIITENGGWAKFIYCVRPDTLIFTENGLQEIGDYDQNFSYGFTEIDQNIYGLGGFHKATHFYKSKKTDVLKIVTQNGYELTCTPVHPIWDGGKWVESQYLNVGDHLPIQGHQNVFGKKVGWEEFKACSHGHNKPIPFKPDKDFYYFLGLYIAEGSCSGREGKKFNCVICIADSEIHTWLKEFGFVQVKGRPDQSVNSNQNLCTLLDWLGCGHGAFNKQVPKMVLQSPEWAQRAFLKGYFDGDGCATKRGTIHCDSISEKLLKTIQVMLLNFGIYSTRKQFKKLAITQLAQGKHLCWRVSINGSDADTFFNKIGFGLQRKQCRQKLSRRLNHLIDVNLNSLPDNYFVGLNLGDVKRQFKIGSIRSSTLKKLQEIKPCDYIQSLLNLDYRFDKIVSIESDESEVVDFVIPETHSFTSNGFISHNTPRGLSHGWELYERNLNNPDWFVQKLDITQTRDNDGKPIITEDQIEARRREGMPEELIRQEFYVDFDVALAGAIFSKEIDSAQKDGRIKNFPIDSDLPVYTAWDIGRRDPTSIWLFQAYPDYIRMIAYYENTNQGMDHYLEWLRSFAEKRKLRFRNHYHIAPHDIKVHEWTNGQARIEAAAQKGWYFRVAPKLGIQDGINAVRMIFPRLMFHADNCRMGLNALKQYCSDNSGKPIHNFASHPADALRMMACGWHDSFKNEQPQVPYTMPKWNMQ